MSLPSPPCPPATHLLSLPCLPGHRYGFGECYFECNKDQAEELLDKQKEDTLKEIAVLNGEINGIEDTLSGLKTQLCARPPSEPSHALSPRHHTLATHDSPTENEPRAPTPAVLADMAASAATSTWRRRLALELARGQG